MRLLAEDAQVGAETEPGSGNLIGRLRRAILGGQTGLGHPTKSRKQEVDASGWEQEREQSTLKGGTEGKPESKVDHHHATI